MSQKELGTDGRYRRVLRNFGSSGSIQGLEDLPIDPDVDDAKTLGVAALFGFALVAIVPLKFQLVGWIGAGAVVALAAGVIYVSPSDRAPLAWLGSIARFTTSPKRLTQTGQVGQQGPDPRELSYLARGRRTARSAVVTGDRRTTTLTEIERCLPITGAIKRRDGTLVGAVKVDGRDMALAEAAEWDEAARGFENLAGALDGGFEVYSPARRVSTSDLIGGYLGRETDPDVKRNDGLAELIEAYQNDLPRELDARGAATRDFYVLMWVTREEVRRQDHGVLAKLADLPGVGGVIARVGLARRGPSDAEIQARQKSMLSGRKRAVKQAVASIEGCETREVDIEHLTAILEEFWTGWRTRRSGKPAPRNYGVPVVTRGDLGAVDGDRLDVDGNGSGSRSGGERTETEVN